jgi:glucose-1-phosphate thymidylyltransferase
MKGLILSGGKGTRLRPITHTNAKQLVPVANKPVLFYGIEAIRDSGITEIGIVVGDTEPDIRAAVGDGSAFGVRVTYIHQEAPLGLAHAVLVSEPFLRGEPFVMYLGDNLILGGIGDLVDEFRNHRCDSQILLAHVADPTQFGVAELDGGRVARLIEKPKEPKSDLALVGVYMFTDAIWEAAKSIAPSARGELEITDAIQAMVDAGRHVRSFVVQGWWKDTGKLEDMLEANRMVLDTFETRIEGDVRGRGSVEFKVVIEPGAVVEDSTIRGPAIIGRDARIVNSFVGPFTSIYHRTEIVNSEIEHSIVLADSRIRDIGVRITDSLIGENVEITRSARKPKAYRFTLGDSSRVRIL